MVACAFDRSHGLETAKERRQGYCAACAAHIAATNPTVQYLNAKGAEREARWEREMAEWIEGAGKRYPDG